MNPIKFIEIFSPKLRTDIVKYPIEKTPPNIDIINPTTGNDTMYIIKQIQVMDGNNILKLTNNHILRFIFYSMKQANLESHLSQHILKNIIFYLVLMFCISDQTQWYIYTIYCINTDKHNRTSESEALLDLHSSILVIVDYMKRLYIEFSNVLFIPIDQAPNNRLNMEENISFQVYQDIVHILNSIYTSVYHQFMLHVNTFLSDMGYIPSYWPSVLKMRLCLFTELIESKLVINTIQMRKRKKWRLFPMQYKERVESMDSDAIIYYLCFLPEINEKDKYITDPLHAFSDQIFAHPTYPKGTYPVVENLKSLCSKNVNILLRQYIVLHLRKWESIWIKCRWPMTRLLHHTITSYRKSAPAPNLDLLFYILFYKIWQQ